MATTSLGRVMPVDRGAWDERETYQYMDLVHTKDSSYVSLIDDNSGNDPELDDVHWQVYADGRQATAAAAAALAAAQASTQQRQQDHQVYQTDHQTAQTDHTTAQSDHTTASNDHTQASTDHTTAASDHQIAQSDHQTAGTDHQTAEADHTRAEQDHTTAAGDHQTAGTDHQTAEADHTRAEQDHTTAAGDHEQFENFTSGTYPNLTAGDITPDVDELVDATNLFTIQTTGGDADIKSGPSEFVEVRGYLDDDFNPFLADTFVSTGMNLVDVTQYITTDSKKGYYFPVVKGEWGEYATSNKNNGYIILAEDLADVVAVYFSTTKPTDANPGSACPTHTDHGNTYYLPGDDGWLVIVMAGDSVPQSCHIVWNNEMDAEAGEFGNQVKNISTIVQAIHTWGMGALIGPYYSKFDRFNLRDKKTYSPVDRTLLTALTFTMTVEENEGSTTYVFTAAKPSAMKLGGLWKCNYDDLIVDPDTGSLVVRSNTITSLEAFATAVAGKLFYYERTTEVVTNIAAATAEALLDNQVDNFGLSYFLYNGELVSVPAFVTEGFHQTGKGQLFDGLARQALIEEIVAEVFCSLDKRIDGIDGALKNDTYKYLVSSLTQGKFPNYRALNEVVTVFERRGSESPITQGIAPRYVGDIYRDTTNKIKYEAFGLTASDWVPMNS